MRDPFRLEGRTVIITGASRGIGKEVARGVVERQIGEGIVAGVDLGRFRDDWRNDLLIAVTEVHSKDDLDRLVAALAG